MDGNKGSTQAERFAVIEICRRRRWTDEREGMRFRAIAVNLAAVVRRRQRPWWKVPASPFYYAGQGAQVVGANYLLPVNANPTREANVNIQMTGEDLLLWHRSYRHVRRHVGPGFIDTKTCLKILACIKTPCTCASARLGHRSR